MRICDLPANLFKDPISPHMVSRKHIAQSFEVVAAPSTPGDLSQIKAIMYAEEIKRHQILLIDCVPEAELRYDSSLEILQDVKSIGTLRGGS